MSSILIKYHYFNRLICPVILLPVLNRLNPSYCSAFAVTCPFCFDSLFDLYIGIMYSVDYLWNCILVNSGACLGQDEEPILVIRGIIDPRKILCSMETY